MKLDRLVQQRESLIHETDLLEETILSKVLDKFGSMRLEDLKSFAPTYTFSGKTTSSSTRAFNNLKRHNASERVSPETSLVTVRDWIVKSPDLWWKIRDFGSRQRRDIELTINKLIGYDLYKH